MVNNPNQEIRTNFEANDVFKPVNANQLARAIHYDFIVTQEMFDAYINTYNVQYNDTLDMGNIITSNIDGTIGTFDSVPAPCSIYIAANTTNYKLNFSGRMFGYPPSVGYVIDISAYLEDGKYSLETTKDMLNVYSAYPYRIESLCGGINYWSTISAPVIIDNAAHSWNGVCRVGHYICNTPMDFSTRTGLQVVFQNLVEGYRPSATISEGQAATGYIPTVIFANWMDGSGSTSEYYIPSQSSAQPGLYQSISESYKQYNTSVYLQVTTGTIVQEYSPSKRSPQELRFNNADIGKSVTIRVNGDIEWEDTNAGSTSSCKTLILQDDGVIVPYADGAMYVSQEPEAVSDNPKEVRYSILQDGKFRVYKKVGDVKEYRVPYAGSDYGLRPNDSTRIIWNTWYKITAYGIFDTDEAGASKHIQDIVNTYTYLDIITDYLLEGVVYEVVINVRANATARNQGDGILVDYGGMHAPGLLDRPFSIQFYDSNGVGVKTYRWANDNKMCDYFLRPSFNRVPSTDTQLAFGHHAGYMYTAPVLASAVIHFVKINGKVYTMGY